MLNFAISLPCQIYENKILASIEFLTLYTNQGDIVSNTELYFRFTYLLEADNVQPAKGMFTFNVKPGGSKQTGPVTDKDGGIHISPRTGEPPKTTPMPPLPTIGENKDVTSSGTHVCITLP